MGERKLDKQGRRRREILFLVALLAVAAAFTAWQWGPLAKLTWEYDEGLNLIKSRLVARGYRPYREIWSDQPPLFTLATRLAFRTFGETLFVGRALALAFGLAMIVASAWLSRRWGGVGAGLLTAALLILSPHVQRLSRVVLIGLPAVALGVLALAIAGHGRRRWAVVLSGTLFAASLLVKPLSAPIYPALLLALALPAGDDAGDPKRRPTRMAIPTLLTFHLALIAPLALTYLFLDGAEMLRQVVGTYLKAGSAYSETLRDGLTNLTQSLGGAFYLGLALLSLVGLAHLLRANRRRVAAVAGAWLSGTALAVLLQTPQRWHQHLLLIPPLTVLAAIGMVDSLHGLRNRARDGKRGWNRSAIPGVLGMAIVLVGLPSVFRTDWQARDELLMGERISVATEAAQRALDGHLSGSGTVVSDDPMLAFRGDYSVPAALAVPSLKRVRVGALTAQEAIDVTAGDDPDAVAFLRERFNMLPGYRQWVAERYALLWCEADRDRWLYVAPRLDWPQPASFGDSLEYLGASAPHLAVEGGESLSMTLYWRVTASVPGRYTLFAHLIDAKGDRWGQVDLEPYDGAYPSYNWQPGEILAVPIALPVAEDAPSGEMRLAVGWYNREQQRLPAHDAEGTALPGDQVILDPKPVVRWPATYEGRVVEHAQMATLGDLVRLEGYDLREADGAWELVLHWRCLQRMKTSYTVFVHVLDTDGEIAMQSDQRPAGDARPTTGWLPEELIVDTHRLTPFETLASADYRIVVGLYELASGQRLPVTDEGGQAMGDAVELEGPLVVD